jgi:hypothetical protein
MFFSYCSIVARFSESVFPPLFQKLLASEPRIPIFPAKPFKISPVPVSFPSNPPPLPSLILFPKASTEVSFAKASLTFSILLLIES